MRNPLHRTFAAICLSAVAFTAAGTEVAQATTVRTGTTSTVGWVRLAHLSPNTPPVDVYLYPFGGSSPDILLKHVAYGTLSPYQPLAAGAYLVAMRGAGASPASSPVISTQVNVVAGRAYTVVGLGAQPTLTLQVLDDELTTPTGKAAVRVIAASLQNPTVSVVADTDPIAPNLHFPDITAYQPIDPGPCPLHVSTATGTQTTQLNFAADSTYTLAILDNAAGAPKVLDLTDAAGTSALPKGGVNTGFGGTAQRQSQGTQGMPLWFWGLLLVTGGAITAFGIRRTRRGAGR